jgi:hypothetical protein
MIDAITLVETSPPYSPAPVACTRDWATTSHAPTRRPQHCVASCGGAMALKHHRTRRNWSRLLQSAL